MEGLGAQGYLLFFFRITPTMNSFGTHSVCAEAQLSLCCRSSASPPSGDPCPCGGSGDILVKDAQDKDVLLEAPENVFERRKQRRLAKNRATAALSRLVLPRKLVTLIVQIAGSVGGQACKFCARAHAHLILGFAVC